MWNSYYIIYIYYIYCKYSYIYYIWFWYVLLFICLYILYILIFYINLPARLSPFCLCVVFRSGVASKHVRMPSLPAGWEEGLDDLDVWLDFNLNPKGSKGDRTSGDSSVCIKIRTPKATGVSYNACMHGPSRSYLGLKLVHLVHFLGQSFPLSSVSPHGGCVLLHLWTWCPSGTGLGVRQGFHAQDAQMVQEWRHQQLGHWYSNYFINFSCRILFGYLVYLKPLKPVLFLFFEYLIYI